MNITFGIAVGIGGLVAIGWAIRLLVRGPRLLAFPTGYLGFVAIIWVSMASQAGSGYRLRTPPDATAPTRPSEGPLGDYITSDTCRSCHPGEYHSWHSSYHRTMTQLATGETVKGDFDSGFVGEFPGLNVRFSRDDRNFWATYSTPRPTGGFTSVQKRKVVMTTGSHHYQVYWTDQPWVTDEKRQDRAVWLVPYVYLFDEQRWVPRHASFLNPPEDTPEFHPWNASCVRCHSTHGISRLDPIRDTYDTRTVEFGISCEACHGPGKEHIEANQDPLRRYRLHREEAGDPTIVNPARLDHERSSETCGQCHSITVPPTTQAYERWKTEGKDYRPGQDLDASALVVHPGRGGTEEHEKMFPEFFKRRFWSDGMVRVAGREYHGLLNTPCFQRGEMSCLSCHSMHKKAGDPRSDLEWANDQLAPGMRGNGACIQCHEPLSEPANLTAHTHHAGSSSGSNCYNCHMPHTTYGLHKGIRSHQIDSPSVPMTLDTGRPNACNLCHLDKTLAWTAQNLEAWYGHPVPELSPDQQQVAASLLWLLQGDAGQRALIASSFAREEARKVSGTEWMPIFLAQLQYDPYHAVQIIANKSLRLIEGFENISRYPDSEKAAKEVLEIWLSGKRNRRTDPELLMDDEGKFHSSEIQRLLRKRDNTPVYLSE